MVQVSVSLSILGLLPVALAATKSFTFNIVNAVVAPDGFSRDAVTVNGKFPGPVVAVNKFDRVQIRTNNRLTDPDMRRSTSIHWHGFFQARTSGMDGPSFVNQCPIPPNTTFLYDFDTAGQTGNFWYHSHLSTQYCDGLRGVFPVYDPKDPLRHLYDVDDASTIITLADWYHGLAPEAQKKFFTSGTVPIPDSSLINGVGRYNGGPLVPFAIVNVVRGKRYRFRVFSLSCRPFFTFSIDNHTFDVMEFDGIEHDPVPAQNFDIYAAQRVSIILNANQTVNNYWIRAFPTGGNPAGNPNFNPALSLAILRYKGAPAVEPTTVNVPGKKLVEGDMHPIKEELPGKLGSGPADVAIVLNIAQPNPPFFDINGISYISPPVPVLLQLLSGAQTPQDLLPSEQVFLLPPNKLIEISVPGTGAHPFHLHGHAFDLVRTSNSDVVNYVNPPRRDVAAVNGGNMTFRFFSENPGAWFLHCHIDWHLEAGLAVVFGEAPADNISGPKSQITPKDWQNLCPSYNKLRPEFQ
ncbi:Laccase-1 [Hypsizygus marmoreus]|uniref:Laccase-1 n=1 Tax=Hypsizygus marmoreus TaxID=39966 RepID=A0A369JY02_HYPMA|nr:Laccase-1 [Hypsizygus marmoreus]